VFSKVSEFLQQVVRELRLVHWPDKRRAFRLTIVILALCAALGAYIGILDLGLTELITIII